MTFPPIGVTAIIAGMAVFNRDAAIVQNRLSSINRISRQMEAESVGAATGAAAAFASMASTLTTVGTVGAAAFALAGVGAVKFAADFEQSLSLTQAITGANDEQMAQLTDTIVNLSRTGKLGMEDLNKAATELARAGVPIQDVMGGALKAVEDLAVASGGELGLEKAAKLVATAMNAFGLSVEEVDRVTTAATVVAQNSALTFTDFGTAVQYAAPTFKAAGFTIEDLALAEALLGKNGITGSVAATSLRGVIQRLIKPSKEAQKVMDQYGISLFDSSGKARGFDVVMQQLNHAFGDQAVAEGRITEEQRLHAVATLGLQRTGAAFLILANATTESLSQLRESFQRLKVTDLVAIQMDTLNAQLQVIVNNVKAFAFAFGTELVLAFKDSAKALATWIQTVDLEIFRQLARTILEIGRNIKDSILGGIQTIRDFADAFGLTGPAIDFARNALIGLGAIIAGSVTLAVLSFVGAWTAFVVVVGAATTAIMALMGPLSQFASTLPSIGDILANIGTKLDELGAEWAPWAAQAGVAGQIVGDVLTGLHGVVESLQFILQGNFTAAAQSADGAMRQFSAAAQLAYQELQKLAERVVDLTQFLLDHKDVIIGVAAAYATLRAGLAISSTISSLATILGVASTAMAAFAGTVTAFVAAVTGAGGFMAALGVIVAALGGPVTVAIVAISVLVGVLAAAWIGNWGDIQGKTESAVGYVQSALQGLVAFMGTAMQTIFEAVMTVWNALPVGIREDLTVIVADIQEIWGLLPTIASNLWTQVSENVLALLHGLALALEPIVLGYVNYVIAVWTGLATDILIPIAQFAGNVINGLLELAQPVLVAAQQIAGEIIQGFVIGLVSRAGEVIHAIRQVVDSALAAARAAAGAHSPAEETIDIGEDMAEGLAEGLDMGSYDVVAEATQVVNDTTAAMIEALDAAKRPVRGTAANLVDELVNELYSIQGRVDQLSYDMEAKMTRIGEEVGRKINEAIVEAAGQIERTIADANERIGDLVGNLAQSRSDSGRRDALRDSQDARRRARREAQEDADATQKRDRDLSDAKFKLQQDLEKATTSKQRSEAETRYQQKIADIQRDFKLDETKRLEERQRQHDDAQFERDLEKETQDLSDQLEDEALARSIARAEEERDARISAINKALTEKQDKIREQADREVRELRDTTIRKIGILEDEFAKKAVEILRKGGENMRPLVDNIQTILTGNFDAMRTAADDFTTQVEDAIGALKRLHAEAARAAFQAPALPSPVQGLGSPEPLPFETSPSFEVPIFGKGGRVPGKFGEPLLAIVHGGEFISSLHHEAARWASAMGPQAGPTTYNYNVNAQYANTQSEATVALDMRALVALSRGT